MRDLLSSGRASYVEPCGSGSYPRSLWQGLTQQHYEHRVPTAGDHRAPNDDPDTICCAMFERAADVPTLVMNIVSYSACTCADICTTCAYGCMFLTKRACLYHESYHQYHPYHAEERGPYRTEQTTAQPYLTQRNLTLVVDAVIHAFGLLKASR